jgi:hypothetical protein
LGQIPQAELYEFYEHHIDGHTVESLRAHHAQLHRLNPSLANRAGKHYQQFCILVRMLEDRRQEEIRLHGERKWIPPAQRAISVHPIFLPNPDIKKQTLALLLLVDENKRIKGLHHSLDDASVDRDAA